MESTIRTQKLIQQIFVVFTFNASSRNDLSHFLAHRWKFTERWTESNNIRRPCHQRQLLFFNWKPRTRLAAGMALVKGVVGTTTSMRLGKKVGLEIFSIKNRRRVPSGRASATARSRDASRRDAAWRAVQRPTGREGGGEGVRVSFNYCSIVTHGLFQ